ncbi:DNA polymerase delta, subunit 4-domain-containing protein [Mycena galopus ATCC 62051]|nr:DNA polymerase delta, subunit 4-domain-containing protein [Mycena galopus ATCC 62051]
MPKTTSKSKSVSSSLKQSTLSFSASKRTASSNSQKVAKHTPLSSLRRVVDSDSDEIEVDDVESIDVDDVELSSDEDDEVEVIDSDEPTAKPTVISKPQSPSIVKVTRPREKTSDAKPKLLELDEKDKRYLTQLSAARATRNYLQLIHAEDQDKFHEILRAFDLSYEYGPCIGVTRLERWERATALGLHPPVEIHDILTSRQGTKESYSQCVFHDQV